MRRKPYTEKGIKQKKCFRCKEPAVHQWQICADKNQYRPICLECDIELNKLILLWMGFIDWKKKLESYVESQMQN